MKNKTLLSIIIAAIVSVVILPVANTNAYELRQNESGEYYVDDTTHHTTIVFNGTFTDGDGNIENYSKTSEEIHERLDSSAVTDKINAMKQEFRDWATAKGATTINIPDGELDQIIDDSAEPTQCIYYDVSIGECTTSLPSVIDYSYYQLPVNSSIFYNTLTFNATANLAANPTGGGTENPASETGGESTSVTDKDTGAAGLAIPNTGRSTASASLVGAGTIAFAVIATIIRVTYLIRRYQNSK